MTWQIKFMRIWETLTGQQHHYDASKRVRQATDEMIKDSRKLQEHLRPYTESEDALVALMTDLFNNRSMRDRNHHGSP